MSRQGFLVQHMVTVEMPGVATHPTIEQINKFTETIPGMPAGGMAVTTLFENNRWHVIYRWTTTLDVLG